MEGKGKKREKEEKRETGKLTSQDIKNEGKRRKWERGREGKGRGGKRGER
jgi:hypothetical protein